MHSEEPECFQRIWVVKWWGQHRLFVSSRTCTYLSFIHEISYLITSMIRLCGDLQLHIQLGPYHIPLSLRSQLQCRRNLNRILELPLQVLSSYITMRLWFPVAEKLLQRSLEKWTSFLKLFETSVSWRQSACNSYRNFSLNIVKTGQNLISAYWEVAMASRQAPRKQLWTANTFITKIFNLVLDKFWVNRFWIFVILPKSYNFISIYGQKFPSQSSWQRDHDNGLIFVHPDQFVFVTFYIVALHMHSLSLLWRLLSHQSNSFQLRK